MQSKCSSPTSSRASSANTEQQRPLFLIAKERQPPPSRITDAMVIELLGFEPNQFIMNFVCTRSLVKTGSNKLLVATESDVLRCQSLALIFDNHPLVQFARKRLPLLTLDYLLVSLNLNPVDLRFIDHILNDDVPIEWHLVGRALSDQLVVMQEQFWFRVKQSDDLGSMFCDQKQMGFFVESWKDDFSKLQNMYQFLSYIIFVFVSLATADLMESSTFAPPCSSFSQCVVGIIKAFLHDVMYAYKLEYEVRLATSSVSQ